MDKLGVKLPTFGHPKPHKKPDKSLIANVANAQMNVYVYERQFANKVKAGLQRYKSFAQKHLQALSGEMKIVKHIKEDGVKNVDEEVRSLKTILQIEQTAGKSRLLSVAALI